MAPIRSSEITALITSKINIAEFYTEYFGGNFRFDKNQKCLFHEDHDPSLKIMPSGAFKCHSSACGASGGGPIKFYSLYASVSYDQAQHDMYSKYVEPLVPQNVVDSMIRRLKERPEHIERLIKERGWSKAIIDDTGLGWTEDGERLAIPVYNRYNLPICVYYYNVFNTKGYPKVQPARSKNYGMKVAVLWPNKVLMQSDDILMCAGQGDTLLALTMGFPAVTLGSESWSIRAEDLPLLKGKTVNIVYDQDKAGKLGARKIADQIMLSGITDHVKIVNLPITDEKHTDLTDWVLREDGDRKALIKAISGTEFYKPPAPTLVGSRRMALERNEKGEDVFPFIPLQDLRQEGNFRRVARFEAQVVSKATSTFRTPKVVMVRCQSPKKKCHEGKCSCPLVNEPGFECSYELNEQDPYTLRLMEETARGQDSVIREMIGINRSCSIEILTLQTHAVTKILLAPVTDYGSDVRHDFEALQIVGYFFGLNIRLNVPYLFQGWADKHHKDSSNVMMIILAEPVASTLDAFDITDSVVDMLSPFKVSTEVDLFQHLMDYYTHMGQSVTNIRQRPMGHMACDLVFHSPSAFEFCHDYVNKGSLEALLLGDPRTGKGEMAKGLHRYYEHGECVSGGSISFMNFVGGIKNLKTFRGLCWGRMVANHRSTMIVDEMANIDLDLMGNLSEIRSDAVARVDKDGLHQSAPANVGIIWISNPREDRMMYQFSFGVQAMQKLVGRPEDIARFDYVCGLASGEVPSSVINTNGRERVEHRFTKKQCHELILWIKSRKISEIQFTNSCEKYILEQAMDFGKIYTRHRVPLVQAENIRVKIARVATAIAGKTFSTDYTNTKLLVTEACAKAAVTFLHKLYESPTLSYRFYSKVRNSFDNLDEEKVRKVIMANIMGKTSLKKFCEMFLFQEQITFNDLVLWFDLDKMEAQYFLNALSQNHCLFKKYNWYGKSHAFIKLIKKMYEKEVEVE